MLRSGYVRRVVTDSSSHLRPAPAGAAPPSVTVIVPVRDGAEDLERCLAALGRQDYSSDHLSVVVADNGSIEDVVGVVGRHPGVRYVHEAAGGSYAARNAALAVTTSDVVAFTDGDCDPAPSWVSAAVASLASEPRADMVGGAVELTYRRGHPITGSELFEAVHGFPQADYLGHRHFAVTANMVAWRSTFDRVGLFDGTLMSRGDAEWGQRVHAAGLRQRYAADAVVRHPARDSLSASVSKWRRTASGRVGVELKQGRPPRHFAGSAWWQVKVWITTLTQATTVPVLTTWPQRIRYLAVFSVCRAVYLSAYLRALRTRRHAGI